MPKRAFKRLQGEPEDIDASLVDQIELNETDIHSGSSNSHHPQQQQQQQNGQPSTPGRVSTSANRPHESQPRRSMHQVDIDLEWPMVEIPQELRELRENQDDDNTRSNSQANAIRVCYAAWWFLLVLRWDGFCSWLKIALSLNLVCSLFLYDDHPFCTCRIRSSVDCTCYSRTLRLLGQPLDWMLGFHSPLSSVPLSPPSRPSPLSDPQIPLFGTDCYYLSNERLALPLSCLCLWSNHINRQSQLIGSISKRSWSPFSPLSSAQESLPTRTPSSNWRSFSFVWPPFLTYSGSHKHDCMEYAGPYHANHHI